MKILKGLQSSIILDKCIEFNVKAEGNSIVLYFHFSYGNTGVIKKYYPITNEEVSQLLAKGIEPDFICDNLEEKLCTWLSDYKDTRYFDLKYHAQSIINKYLQR